MPRNWCLVFIPDAHDEDTEGELHITTLAMRTTINCNDIDDKSDDEDDDNDDDASDQTWF